MEITACGLHPTAGANDIVDGREGNDTLGGGAGKDAYIFSVGNDIINETSGDDTIRVRDSYDASDITIAFVQFSFADNALQLTGSSGNTILVTNEIGVEPCAKTRRAYSERLWWGDIRFSFACDPP
jgi:Ca2+-binding RTX toxin-like protein